MSDERLRSAVAFSKRMSEQMCTTPGHEDRKADWLVPHDDPGKGHRWVCGKCKRETK